MFDGEPEKKERYVQTIFDAIAARYDMMNLVMTAGLWRRWQKAFLRTVSPGPGLKVLDVACGTADQTLALAARVGPRGSVFGLDFSEEMLAIGRRKVEVSEYRDRIELVYGNALSMPFPDSQFDLATICFALRNVSDIPGVLKEMARVVKPGGRVVSLELSKPTNLFRFFFYFYFNRMVPALGWLLGSRGVEGQNLNPYAWLPQSLKAFPPKEALADLFREAGLKDVHYVSLTGGSVAIHVGVRL